MTMEQYERDVSEAPKKLSTDLQPHSDQEYYKEAKAAVCLDRTNKLENPGLAQFGHVEMYDSASDKTVLNYNGQSLEKVDLAQTLVDELKRNPSLKGESLSGGGARYHLKDGSTMESLPDGTMILEEKNKGVRIVQTQDEIRYSDRDHPEPITVRLPIGDNK